MLMGRVADEVYQHNLYGGEWVSFASVVGRRPVPLVSLHSTSKGYYGECGHRGGYLELRNAPSLVGTDLHFGALSPLQVESAAQEIGEPAVPFLRQLAWRELYHHQLFHQRRGS